MINKTLAIVAVGVFASASAFAGDKACCAKQASNKQEAQCATFANLNLNADQKAKLETWQAECTKAGCTKESRAKFLKQAQGILSKDQYATLKAECEKSGHRETKSQS